MSEKERNRQIDKRDRWRYTDRHRDDNRQTGMVTDRHGDIKEAGTVYLWFYMR